MTSAGPARTASVLLVDDAAQLRRLIRQMLERHGAFVVVGEAGDGRTGIELARELQPDLVLLDLSMPVMDGFQALPLIRRAAPSAKIAILSGFEPVAVEDAVADLGADLYLAKGTRLAELVRVLSDLVGLDAAVTQAPSPPPAYLHEVRNLLAAARGLVESRHLDDTERAAGLARLAEDMAHAVGVERLPDDTRSLREFLDAALRDLSSLAGRRVELRATDDPVAPEAVRGIRQVLANLLMNSQRYAAEGRGPILVDARCADGKLHLRYADGGPGLSAQASAALDEGARVSSPLGEGVGLSTSSALLRGLGGTLAYAPDDAAFLVTLPLPDGDRPPDPGPATTEMALEVQQLSIVLEDEGRRRAQLEGVLRSLTDAVLLFAHDGSLVFANPAAVALFGQRPVRDQGDLEGRLRVDLTSLESAEPPKVAIGARTVEVAVASLGGGTASPSEASLLVMLRDVTRASEAIAARDTFLAVLSHEVRTPVTTIYGGTLLLQRSHDPVERADLVADIALEADRLNRLVDDLLVISRVERAALEFTSEPVLVHRLAERVLQEEGRRWPRTRFVLDAGPPLPPADGDETFVTQILRNLTTNAAKYGPADAQVEVRVRHVGDRIEVHVLDRGAGIRQEEIDRLFDPFFRSHVTAAQASGAGIGLYVVRQLVEGMRGELWAAPRPGGGADFAFALPVFDDAAEHGPPG